MKQMWKKLFTPTDMTEGTPWKKIVLFTIPMLIGNIAQQLYNTVDSIIVGRYVGDNALAAVGSASPILNLLIVLFIGISVGVSIMVAQYFGAKEREELSSTIGGCVTLTAIVAIALMIVSPFVVRPMLEMLHTPASIIDWCTSYLIIMMVGIAGMAYYNILSGVLRGLGDSVSALVYLLVATVLNIGLDLLFVAVFDMGVAGVALATVIAQFVSAVLCLWKLMHMKEMRVDGFAMMPNFSFGTAMTTYAGQNAGAKQYDRINRGAKQGTLIAMGVSATITGLILIFGKYLMGIFTETEELVDLSMRMMRILAVGYIAMGATQCLSGVMRGAGDTMTPMWISLVTTVLIRVPVAYGISWITRTPELPNGRSECVFISLLCSWVLGALITFYFYKRGKWKKKALGSMEK